MPNTFFCTHPPPRIVSPPGFKVCVCFLVLNVDSSLHTLDAEHKNPNFPLSYARFGRVFPSLQLVCSSLCLCVLTSGSCEFCWSSICSSVDWAPGLEPKSPAWPKITTLHPHAPFRRAYSFGICFMLLHSCFQFLLSSWSKLVDGLSWSLLFHTWKFNLRKHVGLCKLWETPLLMHQQKPSPQNFAFKINVPITQI